MKVPPFSLSKQISELGPDLDEAVLRVLRSGQYIGGEEVDAFEDTFAKSIGVPFAVGCNSGTDALILALRALDIGEGDEVITSAFSFFATAEAISAVGATPVFVDVDPSTYLIDLELVKKAITSATRAVLPVHLFGRPVDMQSLMCLAKENGLKVIEDCAQASGAVWNGRFVGSWGDIGCFSFFPTKNLGAAGDAGAVTTHDPEISKRVRELAVHGMPRRYVHTRLGYNSRLDALQAAVLNVKLPKLNSWVKQRNIIASRYRELLKDLPGLELPDSEDCMNMLHACNQFVVKITGNKLNLNCKDEQDQGSLIDSDMKKHGCRDWLKTSLEKKGINTIIYYPIPIHLQPAYKSLGICHEKLPITERLCGQVLSLPIFPELTKEQQDKVVYALKDLLCRSTETKYQALA